MEKIEFLGYLYVPSDSVVARGRKEVNYYLKKGYFILYGGNGSYRMCKPAVAKFIIMHNENKIQKNIKEAICKYYNTEKISSNKVKDFYDKCKSGEINFEKYMSYDE